MFLRLKTGRYFDAGEVVHESPKFGLHSIAAFFVAVVDFLVFFFKTIFDPKAADEYAAKRNRRSGRGGGGPQGGPPKPPPYRPRVAGFSDLRDAGGSEYLFALLPHQLKNN